MQLRSALTRLKVIVATNSAYLLLGPCLHASASTADGQYIKANVAYSCSTPSESATLSRIFLDDERYAEQWISKTNPGAVSHLIIGKWKAQFEPGKAGQITFSDNVRLDPRSNQQVVVSRAPEQVMPSKSDAKRVYFFDNNGRVQLTQCEESTVAGTKQMTVLAKALWDDTAKIRATESTPIKSVSRPPDIPPAGDKSRAIECERAPITVGLCLYGGWEGEAPHIAGMSGRNVEKWAGLSHVLSNSQRRRIVSVYEPQTGACGEVVSASGQYKGSNYSGDFYCDKTFDLNSLPASMNPTTYPANTNPLLGTWRLSNRFASPGETWRFDAGWSGAKKSEGNEQKIQYRLIGDNLAIRNEREKVWTLYILKSLTSNRIEIYLTRPAGSSREQYVLIK